MTIDSASIAEVDLRGGNFTGKATTRPPTHSSMFATQNKGMKCVRAQPGKLERMKRFNKDAGS